MMRIAPVLAAAAALVLRAPAVRAQEVKTIRPGMTEADVRAALDAPDHLGPSFEKRWHARKKVAARTLEVVFWRQRTQSQVLTAYWQEPSA
jgi:hypothetical protein